MRKNVQRIIASILSVVLFLAEIIAYPNLSAFASESVTETVSDGDTSESEYWKDWLMDPSGTARAGRFRLIKVSLTPISTVPNT